MGFDAPTLHVATLAGTAVIMSVVSLVDCLLPSHCAARISPMEALRDEQDRTGFHSRGLSFRSVGRNINEEHQL